MRFSRLAAPAGLVLSLLALPSPADEDTLEWLSDYQEALREARKTGKPIFLEYRCEP